MLDFGSVLCWAKAWGDLSGPMLDRESGHALDHASDYL